MEELIHYVWKHRLFSPLQLETTNGLPIEIIDVGQLNQNAGPDFFNAKIKIDSTLWVGNVEIHVKASDWFVHNHHLDESYDSTILHVVIQDDKQVKRTTGEAIPQLVLSIPPHIYTRFAELKQTEFQPKCFSILSDLDSFTINSWLYALQVERLELKYTRILDLYESGQYFWKDILFITLARNFGFGLNGDTFERWAKSLPFRALDKHRDDLFQVEALMFGMSGLLASETDDTYAISLQKEFKYLQQKFNLSVLDLPWKLSKIRPGSFPHIRVAQLAHFYHHQSGLIKHIFLVESVKELYALLNFDTSEYWNTHFVFSNAESGKKRGQAMTRKTKDLILINTVIPFMYAFARHRGSEEYMERSIDLLSKIKAENNYITRIWDSAGIAISSAADSQAVIQLQKEYCDNKRCMFCRFGYQYMKA